VRLLIVDDSAFMRTALLAMFKGEPDTEVRTARNGREALQLCESFDPDVVTLDINMPEMDGLTCLSHIMTTRPRPVIMLSSLTTAGALAGLEAMNMGAVDCIAKPGGTVSLEVGGIREQIVQRVRAAVTARVRRRAPRAAPAPPPAAPPRSIPAVPRAPAPAAAPDGAAGLVVIGCSTGGPGALEDLLSALPADFRWPIVIAQHMPPEFTRVLAQRLDSICAIEVVEVASITALRPGTAFVAKGGTDLLLSRRGTTTFALPAPMDPRYVWHPSVDRLVRSLLDGPVAPGTVGVLLTGMGHDGADTMAELRRRGGHTVAESEATAVVFGMPGELVQRGGAELVLPLPDIAPQLRRWVG
jgi:two-component system chemotaxis response regulator CheB